MTRNAGVYVLKCRYCGQKYRRTNWMIRHHGGHDANGRLLNDTHLISCAKKHGLIEANQRFRLTRSLVSAKNTPSELNPSQNQPLPAFCRIRFALKFDGSRGRALFRKRAMSKIYLPIADVLPTAHKLIESLSDVCDRIEIAGSLRRRKEQVGDIEIVCIPKRKADLLGQVDMESATLLDRRILYWRDENRMEVAANGPKYKKFSIAVTGKQRIQVDLFVTTPECWPVIFAIRTGPSDR